MMANKGTILVVDDDSAIRQSLVAAFFDAGYSVRLAADGLSALAELKDFKPDVLLSDLTMPGMGGRELLAIVRRRFPAIHLIAMSGAYSSDEVPDGIAADAFCAKGVHLSSRLFEILPDFTSSDRSHLARVAAG
jgi:CheY-like chemotaxis protein